MCVSFQCALENSQCRMNIHSCSNSSCTLCSLFLFQVSLYFTTDSFSYTSKCQRIRYTSTFAQLPLTMCIDAATRDDTQLQRKNRLSPCNLDNDFQMYSLLTKLTKHSFTPNNCFLVRCEKVKSVS